VTEQALSLHRKLSEIYAAVDRIPKSGTAPQAMGGFKFVMVGDVADAVRKELSARKVTMLPVSLEPIESFATERPIYFQRWRVTWRFTDGESGETIDIQTIGEGADSFDKGANKCMTSSMKYALLMAFLVPTGEDPELTDHAPRAPQAPRTAVAPRPAPTSALQQMIEDEEPPLFEGESDGFQTMVRANTAIARPTQNQPTDSIPMCPTHNGEMKPDKRSSHQGEWSCTRKNQDGSWCSERR
jgi:hypothetical protein